MQILHENSYKIIDFIALTLEMITVREYAYYSIGGGIRVRRQTIFSGRSSKSDIADWQFHFFDTFLPRWSTIEG